MNDIPRALRDGDPLVAEPAMRPDDVQRVRRRVREAGQSAVRRRWTGALWLVTTGALTTAGLALAINGMPDRRAHTAVAPQVADSAAAAEPASRQLQFATPGGTRIIWVFDPTFDVR